MLLSQHQETLGKINEIICWMKKKNKVHSIKSIVRDDNINSELF